jgi:putative ABC transport system substrate-binding protein
MIGFLHFGQPTSFAFQVAAFKQGLKDAGYIEGQNFAMEWRWAEGKYDRLPAMAVDLVDRKVDLIAAIGPPGARAAKAATSTIPIVFISGEDPVQIGLVTSLNRPGGNLTGVSILAVDLTPKRLELLSEMIPQARSFALLVNPDNANPWLEETHKAAQSKGLRLHVLKARSGAEIDSAFAAVVEMRAGGLIIGDDVFFGTRRAQFVALALRHSVPTIERWREFAVEGGLMTYGPSLTTVTRQLGIYAGRILNGERPSDLPIQQPTAFELVINAKAARALGLTVPPTLLARADEVLE